MGELPADDFSCLRISEGENQLRVHLDRPATRNAIDQEMVEQLHRVCAYLERSPRILILGGTSVGGRGVFASGADIAQLRQRRRADALQGINSRVFDRIAKLPLPVIALLDGYALGGGAELAWAADFRIGTPELKIGQPETGLGIIPAAGALWRLKELTGEAIVKEILFTGRILTAEEALQFGLVSSLVSADELNSSGDELAQRIAKQDSLAVQIAKKVLAMPREAHPQVDDLAQAILFESEAKFERMQAFLGRRHPPREGA